MTLQDLKKGQMVTLEVVWGETKYDIPTEVMGATKDAVLIRPFSYKGTTLDLGTGKFRNMIYNLHAPDIKENDRKVWRRVQISTLDHNDSTYYAVRLSAMGHYAVSSDRRENKRMVLDLKGVLWIKGTKERIQTIVHDISDGGMSMYVPKGFLPDNRVMTVSYDDSVQGHGFTLNIDCVQVRSMVEGEYVLLGCRITNMDKDLLAYICLRKTYDEALH